MAIVVDEANKTVGESSSTTSLQFDHDGGSGSNRCLEVSVASYSGHPTGVTYNGVPMSAGPQSGTTECCSIWYLKGAATGTNQVAVNFSGSHECVAIAVNVTGVDQATPVGTGNNNNGSSTTASVSVSSATDEVVIDAFADWNSVFTKDASQTLIHFENNAGAFENGGSSYKTGSTTTTMQWTGTLVNWYIVALPFKPAAAGGRVFKLAGEGGGLAGVAKGLAG